MSASAGHKALRATISPEQASARLWDVLVAGAGPAGSIAAYQLARHGVGVLLVDKAPFPRWKVCGCCLNSAALGALSAIGLGKMPQRLGAIPLRQVRLAVPGATASLHLPASVSVSRQALDTGLVRAAIDVGVSFLPDREAILQPDVTDVRRAVVTGEGGESSISARVVIAADGLSGTFLKYHGELAIDTVPGAPIGAATIVHDASEFYAPGTIFMACSRGIYVGAVRLEDGRLDVAAALQPAQIGRSIGLGQRVKQVLEECHFPCPIELSETPWRGTPVLTRFRRRLTDRRLFVLGDAAGYVEPFTGEGISWAVQAAILAVPFVLDSLHHWSPTHASRWETRYRQFFSQHQKMCVFARKLLHSRFFSRAAVKSLRLAPWLASPWLRRISMVDPEVLMTARAHEKSR